jgi:DNA-binding transcriptional regulator YhcF (GntR family)
MLPPSSASNKWGMMGRAISRRKRYHLAKPIYLQVYERIREAMRTGELQAGARLRSTRALAAELGVSRNTVLTAYEMLMADGLVTAKVGSGTRVSGKARVTRRAPARAIVRESQYPERTRELRDPDGNRLYVRLV